MSSISHALQTYDDGNDPQYPICRMHKYRATRTMDGVAAGKPLEIRYGLVLRAEFVGAGKDSGPMRDLYFKILPKGACSIAGCLVGFPVLDARPHWLGHSVQHTTHCFEELGGLCPAWSLPGVATISALCRCTWIPAVNGARLSRRRLGRCPETIAGCCAKGFPRSTQRHSLVPSLTAELACSSPMRKPLFQQFGIALSRTGAITA